MAVAFSVSTVGAQGPMLEAEVPMLEADSVGKTDGHTRLVWKSPGGSGEVVFELQQEDPTDAAGWLTCYRGPDRASFRSGLQAGDHRFRVRQAPNAAPESFGPWSETVTVTIAPYALSTAWSLFAVGASLTAALLGYLGLASRRKGDRA
jgi:hypothetical protein